MKNLWLIDDDPIFRYVFRQIVESHNLADEYLEFENGELGYHTLIHRIQLQQQPDIILLDINMPVLNGWGFLEKIANIRHDDLKAKIYMISSSIAETDQQETNKFPMLEGYVNKPICVDKICALL